MFPQKNLALKGLRNHMEAYSVFLQELMSDYRNFSKHILVVIFLPP